MDNDRLSKLMAMTTSDNDGEALNALRMANKMLSAEKLTWEEVLGAASRHVTVSIQRRPMQEAYQAQENWVAPHLKDKPVIEQMFRTIYASAGPAASTGDGSFMDFLNSVHKYFETHGQLTNGQYQALRRAYSRCRPKAS